MEADLFIGSNNGVRMIWPSPKGRLAHLVQQVPYQDGMIDHRGWVFVHSIYIYEDGTHDFTTRGLAAGSNKDAEVFITMCRELGFSVKHGSAGTGFIPMSNGKEVIAERPGGESYIHGYSDREVRLCRVDLPTREELEAVLEK